MNSWKIPVGFAAFGAVVSLLAGIIGGNPFGVILLRLILSAAICGGLGLGVNLIVRKYFPELSANPAAVPPASGEEVDIVIDDEIPLSEESEEAQLLEPVDAEEEPEAFQAAEAEEEAEARIEHQEDVLPPVEPAEADSPGGSESDDTLEEFVPGIAAEQVTDFQDLDALPDIDTFNPSEEQTAAPSQPPRRNSKVDEVIQDQNPENLARAVRTFMKKDQ
jgi:hypothetical protein